ncbi:hypothetical protein [Spiroplasma melliferum]|uniref:hypothetical protein n=1 Tax=Spiroplasma melliferum TaxID=2134 RepID=UPI000C76C69E|nr:hypothetical protein [Spiroplasma melliferum]
MKITSKIKGTLKESYRSIKKSIKTMLAKLGLNKSQVQEATARTLNAVEVEITQFLNEEMQKVDLLSTPNPSIKGLAEPLKPQVNKTYGNGQTEANKYKEMLTELNSFLANEKQLSSKTVAKAPVPLPRTKFNHNLTTETKDDESYGR